MAIDNKSFSDNFKRRIYEFILRVIKFVESLPKADDFCRIARDQILRSVTSIGANYVEAIAGSSKKDFTNFLSHSLKSANETKFWLALLRDTGKGNSNEIGGLLKELIEISNILGSSVRTLRNK
ncbi:four helix bundle protein [Patescibacteria group bacterium]|nr:four helix bundle protein [Patescibacteria group bacterium]